jgi:putative MATE family efflux protein
MRGQGFTIDDATPVWRSMLTFLVPLMLSNILQAASGTFTAIYLGHMIGVGALAAASSIFPMVFFLVSFFIGIASASSVLIGQAYGARDPERVARVAGTTLTFAILVAALVGAAGIAFDRTVVGLIGTPPDIFEDTVTYARITFAGMPLFFIYIGYTTFLRGVGDSRTPFVALIATTIAGAAVTPALIAGILGLPKLGIAAAPVGNLFSMALGTFGLLVWLQLRDNPLKPSRVFTHMRIDRPILGALIRIGIPTGLQLVMVSLSEIAVLTFVNRFGSQATAAYGAVNQIVNYVQFPAISIGITASIFGAQSIGARRVDRLHKILRAGVILNYAIGGVLIVICYAFARQLLSMFVSHAETLDIAYGLLSITLWSYVIFGNTAVLSGLMRSSGTVLWPTAIGVVAIWAIEVPVAWTLSHGTLGLRGIWIAYPITYLCSLSAMTFYYYVFWKRRPISALHQPVDAVST